MEWDVQNSHIGVMVRCPQTFDHKVYMINIALTDLPSYSDLAATQANSQTS